MTEFTKEYLKNKIAEEAIGLVKAWKSSHKANEIAIKLAGNPDLELVIKANRDKQLALAEEMEIILELTLLVHDYENWEE